MREQKAKGEKPKASPQEKAAVYQALTKAVKARRSRKA
jgi:hypothetical protein